MSSSRLDRQLAEIRLSLLRGDLSAAAYGAAAAIARPEPSEDLVEIVETVAAVLATCWALHESELAEHLIGEMPLSARPAIGLLAEKHALGALEAEPHPSAESYLPVARAADLVRTSSSLGSEWRGFADWYMAKAGQATGASDWAEQMEQACCALEALDSAGSTKGLLGMLSIGRAELAEHYSGLSQPHEAFAQMKHALDLERRMASGPHFETVTKSALLAARTGHGDEARKIALEGIEMVEAIASPGYAEMANARGLLLLEGVLAYGEMTRLLVSLAGMADRVKPFNEVVWHLAAVAAAHEARGSWEDARSLWRRTADMASQLGLDGVLGATSRMGLVRAEIELGNESEARLHLQEAAQLLSVWPDPEAERAVALFGSMLD